MTTGLSYQVKTEVMKELIEAEPVAMCMLAIMATVVVLCLVGHGLNVIRKMIKASAKGDEILFV